MRFEEDKSGRYFDCQGAANVALPPKKEAQGKDLGSTNAKRSPGATRKLAGNGYTELIPGHGRVMGIAGHDKATFMAHEELSDF